MVPGQQLDPAVFDVTLDSAELGWQALRLRRLTSVPEAEDVIIPALADQTITMLLSGTSDVASGVDSSWKWARTVPGTISMTAPGRPTRVRWRAIQSEPLRSLSLQIPYPGTARIIEEVLDRDPDRVGFPDTLAVDDPVLQQTMRGLVRATEDGLPEMYAEAAIDFLTVHVLLRHTNVLSIPHTGEEDQRIQRARTYLRDNMDRPVSLVEVADEVGMSRYHFQRMFLEATGETPNHFLTRLRIEATCRDLSTGRASITEIAGRYGFSNPSWFSVVFRRATGFSPTAYRRLHRR